MLLHHECLQIPFQNWFSHVLKDSSNVIRVDCSCEVVEKRPMSILQCNKYRLRCFLLWAFLKWNGDLSRVFEFVDKEILNISWFTMISSEVWEVIANVGLQDFVWTRNMISKSLLEDVLTLQEISFVEKENYWHVCKRFVVSNCLENRTSFHNTVGSTIFQDHLQIPSYMNAFHHLSTWSYSLVATMNKMEVISSKHWNHFCLWDRWPPTSMKLQNDI